MTVIKEGSSWYASCLTSAEQTPWIHKYPVCGVDVGVSRPVVIAYLDDQGELLHKSTGKSFSVALAKKKNAEYVINAPCPEKPAVPVIGLKRNLRFRNLTSEKRIFEKTS